MRNLTKSWPIRYVASVIALMLAAVLAWGQAETGQIAGTVLDQTGAVVQNANVTATNTATGASRATITNAAGVYAIPNLAPGTYDVSITASGFSTYKQTVAVGPGVRVGVDAQMKVGATATTVEVAENAVAVNTETQSLTDVINGQQVTELPSLTRNPYDFVATLPNVSADMQSGRGVGFAINGMRSSSTNVLLDGVANNDEFLANVGQPIPLDSVQEYSVTTNTFTAEVGRAAGGVVNVVTKGGSNNFHGTAYEFNRVSALGSNSFYNNANELPKQIYDRNNFGYSIGGPIKKNKLFFFENTEWTRVRSSANEIAWTPSSQLISAANANTQAFFKAFGNLRSDLTTIGTVTKGDLASQNKTCQAGGLCAALPNSLPMFNKVTYRVPTDAGGGNPQNTYDLVGRVDYNLSDKTQLYFRYARFNENDFAGVINTSPYSGFETGQTNVDNAYIISATHTFSPTFVSQTKLNYNRLNNLQPLGTAPVGPTLYMSPTTPVAISGFDIAFPGYNEFTPGSAIPFGGPQNFATINEDISKIKGKHDIRFGGQFTYFQDNRAFGAYEEAVEGLGTKWAQQMENFLGGNQYQFQAAIYPQGKFPGQTVNLPVGPPDFTRSNRYHEAALYAQDSWKIKPRLTLNLGIRWEYYGVQHDKNPNLDANYYWGSGSNTAQMLRNGNVFTVPNSPIGGLWNKDWHDFAPRVGFAWDVFGDSKTSLRGGYGIGYERNFGNVTFNVIQNPPNYAVISVFSGTSAFPTIPIYTSNSGPLAGSSGSATLPTVSLRDVDNNIKTAYAHLFSLSLEHQFGTNALASIGYSGSMGENLYSIEHLNNIGYGNFYLGDPCKPGVDGDPGTCTSRIRTTQYSNINVRTNGGISNYNALIGRFTLKNLSKIGLTLDMNYTYSHAIDNLSSTFSDGQQGNYQLGFVDPFHPGLDRGSADFDAHHRVAISAVWQIPIFKGSSLRDKILGGWEIDPIFTAHSGNPFTLYDCGNAYTYCPRAFIDGAVPRSGTTNVASPNGPDNYNYLDFTKLNVASWFDPRTGISDVGTFPANMVGRNSVFGPGIWNVDVGVYKNTSIGERFKLQLRLELYNAFNHANFWVYGSDTDVASFNFVDGFRGQAFNQNVGRDVQLGAKFIF